MINHSETYTIVSEYEASVLSSMRAAQTPAAAKEIFDKYAARLGADAKDAALEMLRTLNQRSRFKRKRR